MELVLKNKDDVDAFMNKHMNMNHTLRSEKGPPPAGATETVRTAILEAVAAFPQVTDEPAPTVVLSEYGASSISYLVRLWVSAADYWTVYYGMNEKVRETFAAHGVEMTYDHLNVHMIKD